MQLKLRGFKSRDQELEIKGRTLIVGPNGSGKSAVADAVRFFALGYVPHLGKRPQDTALLMPDEARELSVEFSVASGNAKRTLYRKEKGFELGASCSWLSNAKPTENAKAITSLFGKEEIDVAEVLDLRELLNATPNARAARLEALVSSGRRTAAEILDAVKRRIVQRLGEISDERMAQIKDYKAALPMVAESCYPFLAESAEPLEAKISAGGIPAALAWANEEKKRSSEGLKRRESAAHELKLRAVEVPEPDPREIAALEKQRTELDQRIGALSREIQGFAAAKARRKAVVEASANAFVALTGAREGAGKLPEWEKAEVEARAKLKEFRPEPIAPKDPDFSKPTKMKFDAAELIGKSRAIKTEEIPIDGDLDVEINNLEAELADAEKGAGPRILAIAAEIEAATPPKLRKLITLVRQLREIAKELGAGRSKEEIEVDLKVATDKRVALNKSVDRIRKSNEAKLAERTRLQGEADALERDALKLWQEIDAKAKAERKAFETERTQWYGERAGISDVQKDLVRAIESARARLREAEIRYEDATRALEAQGAEPEAPAAIEPLQGARAEVDATIRKLNAAAAVHVEIQRGLEAIAAAKAERDVYAAIEWALQGERSAELSGAGGRFLEEVAAFLKAGGREEKPFIHPGAAIGWTTPEHDVHVQAMSGGEWALFTAAVTTAALLLRPSTLKILLVEAGEMDGRTLSALLRGIASVGEGLSAAIVTTWREPEVPMTGFGFNLIRTTAETVSSSQG